MGPLHGLKIVELAGIGPGPFAAMLLADLGATVLRIERTEAADLGIQRPPELNPLLRNRERLALDLKKPESIDQVLKLLDTSDGLIEGFRPGVAERLGLGPDRCLARNRKLVYGRVTGWGQTGPLAQAAGHDLNYIALTGALDAIGRAGQPPSIPLALVGDFGGGALYLALGMLAALLVVRGGGDGQVVDAAIVDGAASLASTFFGLKAAGLWQTERGTNILDSGAPFYEVYECKDGKWISVSTIERRFFQELLQRMGLDPAALGDQYDRAAWPGAKAILAERFRQRTQREWCEVLEGSDACFAPVLSFDEAPMHHHMQARGTFIEVAGVVQPAPAPRFSHSIPAVPRAPAAQASRDFAEVLSRWTSC